MDFKVHDTSLQKTDAVGVCETLTEALRALVPSGRRIKRQLFSAQLQLSDADKIFWINTD